MDKNIEISTAIKGDVSIIYIKGDVTNITGGAIEKAYESVSDEGAKKILFCFDKEGYINSVGISYLISIASKSRKNGQMIRFTGLTDHFIKIFTMIGLTKYAEILSSEEEALVDF